VRVVQGTHEFDAPIRDISRRGIFLYVKDPPGRVGTILTLKLSLTAGIRPLTIRAQIVRVVREPPARGGGVLGIGLHFHQMTNDQEAQVLGMIERAMLGPGTNKRAFPRVYHLAPVTVWTTEQEKGDLLDIGEGGLGLSLPHEVPMNSDIIVDVAGPGEGSLKLQGWVVSCDRLDKGFRIGVRFARLSPGLRGELQSFLKRLYLK
jgi:hypothetical protein